MNIIARIEKCVQIGSDDYRVYPITKIFDSTITIDEIISWAKTNGPNYFLNDIELTQPEE